MTRRFPITLIYQTVFIWLAMAALLVLLYELTDPFHRLDIKVLAWADSVRAPFLDSFFQIITWFGSLSVLLPVMIMILIVLNRRGLQQEALFLTISLTGASLLNYFVKLLFNRQRPDLFPPIIPRPLDASFPSGHSAQILALVIGLSIILSCQKITNLSRCYIGLAILMGILVPFSRIYLQVHYPSDTLGGLILASFWVFSVANAFSALQLKLKSPQPGRNVRRQRD